MQAAEHWHRILSRQSAEGSSWFSPRPSTSLELIRKYAPKPKADSVVDAGGGGSTLAEHLLRLGYARVMVADWAPAALDWTYRRLGNAAERFGWVCGDVTSAALGGPHRVWHDRGCFHYLPDAKGHAAYVNAVRRSLVVSGHAIIGAYTRGAPARASGLPVMHFSQQGITQAFGPAFKLVETRMETSEHARGRPEPYLYAVLRRLR